MVRVWRHREKRRLRRVAEAHREHLDARGRRRVRGGDGLGLAAALVLHAVGEEEEHVPRVLAPRGLAVDWVAAEHAHGRVDRDRDVRHRGGDLDGVDRGVDDGLARGESGYLIDHICREGDQPRARRFGAKDELGGEGLRKGFDGGEL